MSEKWFTKAWRFLKKVTVWNLCATQLGLAGCLILQAATGVDFGGVACAVAAAGGVEALVSALIKVWEIAKGKE